MVGVMLWLCCVPIFVLKFFLVYDFTGITFSSGMENVVVGLIYTTCKFELGFIFEQRVDLIKY